MLRIPGKDLHLSVTQQSGLQDAPGFLLGGRYFHRMQTRIRFVCDRSVPFVPFHNATVRSVPFQVTQVFR